MAEKPAAASRTERPTRKAAQTRQRILDAAAELLGDRGPEGLAMADIAERAGMSKGSAYYYFSDCDQVVREVVEAELDKMVAAFERAAATATSARDGLVRIAGSFVEMLRKDRLLVRFVLGKIQGPAPDGDDERVRLSLRLLNLVSVQLERGKAEGLVRDGLDVRFGACAILGVFLAAAAMSTGFPTSLDDGGAALEGSLLEFITHGVSAVV